ncbi:MAG: hypothetical protein EBT15_09975 [Betaproteobacteria bacterium]|nr:hypothetical protein [Betaproteobacteria bacterium]
MMTFGEWLEIGERNGFCTGVHCYFHDTLPLTASEDEEIDDGGDPCIHVIRVIDDPVLRQQIKENSPN